MQDPIDILVDVSARTLYLKYKYEYADFDVAVLPIDLSHTKLDFLKLCRII